MTQADWKEPPTGGLVAGFIILTLEFHREDGLWVGFCRELGTATDGRSFQRVEEELLELAMLHLNALEDAGERDRFFQEHSIKLYTNDVPKEIPVPSSVKVTPGPIFFQFTSIKIPARPKELVGAG